VPDPKAVGRSQAGHPGVRVGADIKNTPQGLKISRAARAPVGRVNNPPGLDFLRTSHAVAIVRVNFSDSIRTRFLQRDDRRNESNACCLNEDYQSESLGYRTFYLWIADQNLMIAMQSNSQPPEETDKLSAAVNPLYEVVRKPTAG
jgi:hypothetical protein